MFAADIPVCRRHIAGLDQRNAVVGKGGDVLLALQNVICRGLDLGFIGGIDRRAVHDVTDADGLAQIVEKDDLLALVSQGEEILPAGHFGHFLLVVGDADSAPRHTADSIPHPDLSSRG